MVRDRPSQPPARYNGGDEIARGGMGRVIEATDTLLDRVVALKQALTLDPETLRRFARETKITARLEHPSIVPVYDAGIDGDAPFYVMRRVSGRPLSELIGAAPTLAERLALVPNLLATAQAVAHAHSRGIVHRDIKPSNILVGEHGETVVIDWGLAKVVDDPDDDDPLQPSAGDSLRTRAGTVFGTPGFMSPGQLRGEPVGYAADVYALGASLYFLLVGKPPHHAPTGDAMMALAAKGPPTPITHVVPGVPRELATIVETALAYGEASYLDAGAFVDDLRRFSTGQLVASHRYSTAERFIRFVRKHRAAVAVALAAVVVVSIVATISVQRILTERDRADAEAHDAAAAQRSAGERAEQLLLLRARALVDTNPTEALAVLKDLSPTSTRLTEGHAIANAALMRGVAFGIRGPEAISTVVEIDPTGTRMLQVTVASNLHVWDLVGRKELFTKKFVFGTRATWIGKRILIHGPQAPVFLDPETGATEPLSVQPLKFLVTSDDQSLIVAKGENNRAVMISPDGRTATPILPDLEIDSLAVAGDGTWYAVSNGQELVVLSRDGVELTRRTAKRGFSLMRASRSKHLAAIDDGATIELSLDGPKPVWRTHDTTRFHRLVIMFAYRGEELLITTGGSQIVAFREDRLVELIRPEIGVTFTIELGDGEQVMMSGNNLLLCFTSSGLRMIRLPHSMSAAKLGGRRGQRRFVVVSGEAILVYDLDDTIPRRLKTELAAFGEFLDEDTLLISSSDRSVLWWHDLRTGREISIKGWFGAVSRIASFDQDRGTAVVSMFDGEKSELFRLTKNDPTATPIYTGPGIDALDVFPNGDMIVAAGPEIGIVSGSKTVRELVTLDHRVDSVALLGGSRFVAISTHGDLVRGEATGGTLERARIPTPRFEHEAMIRPSHPLSSTLTYDRDGNVFAAWGPKVWRWAERLEVLAELDSPVIGLYIVDRYVLALLPSARALLIDRDTGVSHPLPAHGEPVVLNSNGSLMALEIGGYYQVLEPQSRMLWPTPIPRMSTAFVTSPNGTKVIHRDPESMNLWRLPRGEGPIRPRLEQHTNAIESADGQLVWPWRVR